MKERNITFIKSVVFAVVFVMTVGITTVFSKRTSDSIESQFRTMGDQINAKLEASGSEYRIGQIDYITHEGANEAGNTIFFNDRGNKQLGAHWVYGDPRRGGFTDIAYAIDGVETAPGLPVATIDAIDRAMNTWDSVKCSDIPIFRLGVTPFDAGFVQFLSGLGGAPFPIFDITHAGWLPFLPPNVLGVTFTFVFVGGDTNNDGKSDTAFREIYYNSNFLWGINSGFPFVDIETVALHEAGHGLSQAHFGKLFQTNANGKFHFAPRALMNAGYTGIQQDVAGTDKAGHCSIWASWGKQ